MSMSAGFDINSLLEDIPLFAYFGKNSQTELKSNRVKNMHFSCVATTSVESGFAFAFEIPSSRMVHTIQSPNEIVVGQMNRRNLPVICLNSCEKKNLTRAEKREQDRKKEDMLRRMAEAVYTSLGRFVFFGYDPQNPEEFSAERLLNILEECGVRRPVFFGIQQEQVEANQYLGDMQKDLLAEFVSCPCYELLENDIDWAYSENFEEELCDTTIYIGGQRCEITIATDEIQQAAGIAELLTVENVEWGGPPAFLGQERLSAFLKQGSVQLQWYGYNPETPLYVKRCFHESLLKKVKDSLEMVDGSDVRIPMALYGQTCSSKSVEMLAVVSEIFREKKFPIVRILAPDCNFGLEANQKGNGNLEALNRLLLYVEGLVNQAGQQARNILVVWDCNEWKPSYAMRLQNALRNKGRRAVVFFTSLNQEFYNSRRQQHHSVKTVAAEEAKVELEPAEVEALGKLLQAYTDMPPYAINYWKKRSSKNPKRNLLNYLYYLVDGLHPQLANGLNEELDKSMKEIRIESDRITKEEEISSDDETPWVEALKRWKQENLADIQSNMEEGQNDTTDYKKHLEIFLQCLALLSSSPAGAISMPQSMALGLLAPPDSDIGRRWFQHILNMPWLQYHHNGEDEASADYSLEFRTPLEAELFLSGEGDVSCVEIQDRVTLLKTMLDLLVDDQNRNKIYSQQACLDALEKFIRRIGPNGPKPMDYQGGWENIAEAIHNLWENGVFDEKMVTQEVTYRREAAQKEQDEIRKLNMLEKAYDTAVMARKSLIRLSGGDETSTGVALLVESILCWDRALSISLADKEPWLNNFSFEQNFQSLRRVIEDGRATSYVYSALCILMCRLWKCEKIIDGEKIEKLGFVLELLDRAEAEIYDQEIGSINADEFQKHKLDVLDCLKDGTRLAKYKQELLEKGSAMGIYVDARKKLYDADIRDYKITPNALQIGVCQETLDLLENQNALIQQAIRKSPGCQFMRLNLYWLCKNGDAIFPDRREAPYCTYMQQEAWKHLKEISSSYLQEGLSSGFGDWYGVVMLYVYVLSCAQLGDYMEANRYYKELNNQTDGVHDAIIARHLLCDNGSPRLFHGRFDKKNYYSEKRTGYAEVEEIKSGKNAGGRIYYRLGNVGLSAINNDVKSDVQVALSFVDWAVYRQRAGER